MRPLKHWSQKHFRSRFRAALFMRGVTQKSLARELRVAANTVSRWQNSTAHYPNLDHLEAAADFLGVDPGWLAFGSGEIPLEIMELLSPNPGRVNMRQLGKAQRKK